MRGKLLILMLLALAASASAQQTAPAGKPTASPAARPAPPSGPLLQSAPEFSRWEITLIYPDDQAKQDKPAANRAAQVRRLQQITTTKTGKIIHEVSVYASGKQSETWHDGKLQYEQPEGTATWMVKNGNNEAGAYLDSSYVPFPNSGFRDLDWVNAGTYVGTVPFGNRTCLVFVQTGADKLDLSDPSKLPAQLEAQGTVAYIDADTRLPISLRIAKTVRAYHFVDPPTEMQKFPSDLAGEIKKGEDARTRLNQMAPRPY